MLLNHIHMIIEPYSKQMNSICDIADDCHYLQCSIDAIKKNPK